MHIFEGWCVVSDPYMVEVLAEALRAEVHKYSKIEANHSFVAPGVVQALLLDTYSPEKLCKG